MTANTGLCPLTHFDFNGCTGIQVIGMHTKATGRHLNDGIYTPLEMKSREEIALEEYCKVIHIEAMTSLSMLKKLIVPAAMTYSAEMARSVDAKKRIGVDAPREIEKVQEITELTGALIEKTQALDAAVNGEPAALIERAVYAHEEIICAMEEARKVADLLEMKIEKKEWPMPTYADMLFYV